MTIVNNHVRILIANDRHWLGGRDNGEKDIHAFFFFFVPPARSPTTSPPWTSPAFLVFLLGFLVCVAAVRESEQGQHGHRLHRGDYVRRLHVVALVRTNKCFI